MNLSHVGEGRVVLLAGGGKIFTDVAARFTRSEDSLEEIIAAPYDKELVKTILDSGHKAAIEFDYFLFGVEGYARVCEAQLIRKRIASFLIKSGRVNKKGRRSFDMVIPEEIETFAAEVEIDSEMLPDLHPFLNETAQDDKVKLKFTALDLLKWTEEWYNTGVELGMQEESLRYMKQQGTEYKALIGMNAHALHDWFAIRTCVNAQYEIRDLAYKMLTQCRIAAPELFENAGPNCKVLGYCPENKYQHKQCRGKVITKNKALELLDKYKHEGLGG